MVKAVPVCLADRDRRSDVAFRHDLLSATPVLHAFDQLLCEDPSCSDVPVQEAFLKRWTNGYLFRPEPSMDARL